ncbi:MAG: histidinol dehydrogenase, partial [Mesorhizobium sp.]
MAITLRLSDADFEQRFAAFLLTKREVSADVDAVVRAIIARVRAEGDAALIEYTQKFEQADLKGLGMAVSQDDIAKAYDAADPQTIEALKFARDRIRSHHERQRPKDDRYTDAAGVELGSRWTAIEAVGLYVPGGTASYPSSVLMSAVPAKVAGVERIVMAVPAPCGMINPLVLVAADLTGISEI